MLLTDPERAGNIIGDIFNGGEGAKMAKEKIAQMFQSWSDPTFDEADLGKIKNMALQELKEKRLEAQQAVLSSEALKCPQFLKHVSRNIPLLIAFPCRPHTDLWRDMLRCGLAQYSR